jgi:hypothetical protein
MKITTTLSSLILKSGMMNAAASRQPGSLIGRRGPMKYYRCPYCEASLRNWDEEYCPECRAVLSLTRHEMEIERMRLLHSEARTAIANEEWRLAINNLVTLLMMNPENDEARELLKHARRNERLSRYYLEGELHFRAHRWQKSLANLEKVRQIDPDYKDVAGLIAKVNQAEAQEREEERKKKQPAELLIRIFVWILVVIFILVLLFGIGTLIYGITA